MKTLITILFLVYISIINCFGENRNNEPDINFLVNHTFKGLTFFQKLNLNVYEVRSQFIKSIQSEYHLKLSKSNKLLLAYHFGDLINYNSQESFGSNRLYNGFTIGFFVKKVTVNATLESAQNQFQSLQLGFTFQL